MRDFATHSIACNKVSDALAGAGFTTSLTDSPILGAEGNREFLLHGRRG